MLVVVGDSLSAAYKIPMDKGWVHLLDGRLAKQGYRYRVVNASIPGDTTAGGLARLPDDLKRYHPAIVIIALGGNDGLQGLPLQQMQSNLTKMVGLARKSGERVLLVGVRMPPNYGPVYTRRFEDVFKDVARKTGVPLVPEILAGVATHPTLMQSGGLHPKAAGEPQVLDNIWKGLLPLLGKPESAARDSRKKSARLGLPGAY